MLLSACSKSPTDSQTDKPMPTNIEALQTEIRQLRAERDKALAAARTSATPEPSLVRTKAKSTSSSEPSPPSLEEVAAQLADQRAESLWLHRGDSWFQRLPEGDFREMKGVRREASTGQVSKADSLNGLRWSGIFTYSAEANRSYDGSGHHWQKWQGVYGFADFIKIRVSNTDGKWRAEALAASFDGNPQTKDKPTSAEIDAITEKTP